MQRSPGMGDRDTGARDFAAGDPDRLFQEAMDQVDTVLIITRSRRGADGRIEDFEYAYLNAAGLAMMGRQADEVLGHGLVEMFPSHVPDGYFDIYRAAVETGVKQHVDIPSFDENGVQGSFEVDVWRYGDGYVMLGRDVSDRLRRDEALRASREEFRLLAENTADIVFRTDADGRFEWVSPSVERVLGWSPEALLGTVAFDLVHPAERVPLLARHVERSGGPPVHEMRFQTSAGEFRWMSVHATPLSAPDGSPLGAIIGLRDVHEQTLTQQALAASAETFRTAIRAAAIGMALITPTGSVDLVNPAFCALVGRDEDDVIGGAFDRFVDPQDIPRVQEHVRLLIDGAESTVVNDLRLVRSDGERVWIRAAGVLLRDAAGQPMRFMAQMEDVTAERRAREELAYQAFHDALTGLRNRAWIIDILDTELRAAKRARTTVGVLFIDLDNFKVVNDSLGHAAGDELLAVVADRVAAAVDTGSHVGRSGGDEFIVVVPEVRHGRQLELLAARILDHVRAEVLIDGHRVLPTVSIGIGLSTSTSTATGLLRDTDSALFRAKSTGRSRWQFFDQAMHERAVQRLTIEDELREAVASHGFEVHYQPIVGIADRAVIGHEALVRWRHPTRGLLPPGDFLPVAEETGLIVDISEQVLEQVCRMLQRCPDLPGPISVNVSAVQLARPDWADVFHRTLTRHGVAPGRLVVEVTETAVLTLIDDTREALAGVRRMGTGLHLDDFGTGYSSIAVLRDLPVTGLKLDASFVWALDPADISSTALVAGLAGLVEGLHLVGIAEGVETQDQADLLVRHGWTSAQGYLYARPAPDPLNALPAER